MASRRADAIGGALLVALLAHASTARSAGPGSGPSVAQCLVANESSITLRREQKLGQAREQLLVCANEACPADVRAECVKKLAEVDAHMPTIIFAVRNSEGRDLADVKITVDGAPLVDRVDGSAVMLDPGPHRFTFEGPSSPGSSVRSCSARANGSSAS